ncbi:MAG: hypothetical protein EXQ88_05795 [Alphaproteobacteria bacterium]|nr:hypothetical protein [Alphaproteobacteria bacterium]
MAHVVYGLFIVAPLIGIVIAHIKRGDARGSWLEAHYAWQIGSFWWAALLGVFGLVLTVVKIGWLLLIGAALFYCYRVIVGWIALSRGVPPG